MSLFTIALLQLQQPATTQEALAKGLEACGKAKKLGADLALFPEMWQIRNSSDLFSMADAIDENDIFLKEFRAKAQELQMAIAITYLGKGIARPTNRVKVIDRQGKSILDYVKVHLCCDGDGKDEHFECELRSGYRFKVATLEYAGGTVQLGAMICFDREFPASVRTLELKGAEIIITPNACHIAHCPVLGDIRLQQFRTRAFENSVGVALANYPRPVFDGHSCAFNVDGNPICVASGEEGIFFAPFDLDYIRGWKREGRGKPPCYA
jgi:predicted amidohydrolase